MGRNGSSRSRGRRIAGVVVAAGVVAAGVTAVDRTSRVAAEGGVVPAVQIGRVAGPVGTMRAGITMRQQQFRADGRPARAAAPELAMRLDRRHTGGGWRTTLTLLAAEATRVQTRTGIVPLENPFVADRVEIDEDSGTTRVLDRFGRPRALPGRQDTRAFGLTDADRRAAFDPGLFAEATRAGASVRPGGAGVAGLFADRGSRALRRRDLQRQFGPVAGRVRGLDRFVAVQGQETREVLVAPESDLPVELNVATAGALVERAEFGYTPHATGDLRHWLRSERALAPTANGDRLVTEIALSDVALATGGGR